MLRNSISLKSIFLLVGILLLASATGLAQDARIQGTVTDSTGGVIPGVEVTVTNLSTGVSRQAVTSDSGHYSVPQLFTGNYRVGVSMAGFDAQQLELLLDPGQTTEQNFQLSVGAPTTMVEVKSSAARINGSDPRPEGEPRQLRSRVAPSRSRMSPGRTVPSFRRRDENG